MITNPEYIKMVLALPDEFFEDWEWNYGDTFILKVASDKWMVHYIGDFELTNDDIGTWEPIGGCESTFEKVEEARRPVPSQEQLQKICINYENKHNLYSNSNDFLISEHFIASVIEGDLIENIETKTLGEMWLEFVVFLKYAKRWDGEKWV
jgi:hypothetical protein